ncbi:MAG: hypothetical protein HY207_07010 [Nitrospirae bacterium]|nr:hypothetical protein [Nitrospirota bacterium]
MTGWWTHPLPPGLLRLSPIEPNITDQAEFGRAISAVLQGNRVGPVSVALPDPVARVVLFDVARLPSQANDLIQLVRWHLEKTFSVELPSAHFVHQRFRRSDGEPGHRMLASSIDQRVLTQYEQVLLQAGLEPRVIDLATFHRFNLYRLQMAHLAKPEHHFMFLAVTGASLTVMIFESGTPAYVRIKGTRKPLVGPEAVYRILDEVELSLNAYGKEKDLSRVTHLFVSAVGASDELPDRLAARFHLTARVLGAEDVLLDGMEAIPPPELASGAGALGAAVER